MSRPAHSPHSIVRSSVSGATSVAATLPIVCRKGLDSGYTEASSSADSTQAQGEGSSSGDVVSKESSAPLSTSMQIQKLSLQPTSLPMTISNLLERTGYPLVQQNGLRHYGPPPNWDGSPPPRGSEIFVAKIPRDCFEDELVPVFEKVGIIYEIRLMMEYFNNLNRGYAFIVFSTAGEAKKCIKDLDNFEIRQGRTLGICLSLDNCRLFIGGLPKKVTKEDMIQEMEKITEGVIDVILYPSPFDKTKNRGFAFVEYDQHTSAAKARKKLISNRVRLWGYGVIVDWADPEPTVDEEIMSQVKVLYVRNLMLATTEAQLEEAFSAHAPVERVKKIKDYAFVHFGTKQHAHMAMQAMNGSTLDGAQIEVTLSKPVDKSSYLRSSKYNRQLSVSRPVFYVPVDQFGSILPFYPSYSCSPKFTPRNRPAAAALSYTSPPQTSPTMATVLPATTPPQFYKTTPTAAYFDAASPKRAGEEQFDVPALVEVPSMANKSTKNSVQILEEICQKSNWGQPIFTLHSKAGTNPDEDALYFFNVMVPGLGMTYFPAKLTHSIEEAMVIAADHSLAQLGYAMEATSYTPAARPLHYPEIPMCTANFVAVQSSPAKPAMAATAAAIYSAPAYTPENLFPTLQGYVPETVDPATAATTAAIYPVPAYTQESLFPTPQGYVPGTVDPATAATAALAAAIYPVPAYTQENIFPTPQRYVPHSWDYSIQRF